MKARLVSILRLGKSRNLGKTLGIALPPNEIPKRLGDLHLTNLQSSIIVLLSLLKSLTSRAWSLSLI
jgi:hypothetical protein